MDGFFILLQQNRNSAHSFWIWGEMQKIFMFSFPFDFLTFNKCRHILQQQQIVKMLDAQISDIDFYLMKIARLESDLAATQNELITARLRLRTAEDYQIKYELLLKQSQQDTERVRLYEREEEEKIAELISLKLQEKDAYWSDKMAKVQKDLNEKHSRELSKLQEEMAVFKKKHEKCGNKYDDQDLLAFKNKKLQRQLESLEQKINEMKKEHQRNKEEEITQLKESLSLKSKEKQQNEKKIYRQKIQSLETIIINLEKELLEAKTKADPNRENQIDRLKSELSLQIQKNREEIEKINSGLADKHTEIDQILSERFRIEENLMKEKKELKQFIKSLEDKLFQKEKQHEIELINLKERMSKIRDEEIEILKNQIYKIQQNFKEERDSWNIVIVDKDKEIERIRNKSEEDSQRHKEDKGRQLKKIEELKQRLKEHEGEKEAGETQQLINSMKDISAKQDDFTTYENGVTFLDRQLKKAISKIEQKNIEITKLIKELNELRKQSEDEVNGLKEKMRKEKKYFTEKIGQLEEQIRHLNEEIRSKDRESKKKEKDYQSKINLINRQNISLKDLVEQMQKDYTRALENKKAVENSYRQQREKGLSSKSDLTMVKKQKWLQMQRQKNQLEVIYKQKQEQLRNKHEVQMEKMRHETDELKKENQILKGLLESSRKEADSNKENKQALYSQYHKKMATLNLEIALTKNIYDSLVQARSRKSRDSRVSQFDKIEEDASNSEEVQGSPRDPKQPAFMNYSDLQRLTMSFNPLNK